MYIFKSLERRAEYSGAAFAFSRPIPVTQIFINISNPPLLRIHRLFSCDKFLIYFLKADKNIIRSIPDLMRYVITRIILFRGFSHACILDIQLPALNESSFQHSKTRLNVSFPKASSALHITKEYTSRLLNETRNIRYLCLLIFFVLITSTYFCLTFRTRD